MKQRIISTIVLWALIIGLPLILGSFGAFLLILFFAVGTQLEFLKLLEKLQLKATPKAPIAGTVVLLLSGLLIAPAEVSGMQVYALIFAISLIVALFEADTEPFKRGVIPTVLALALIAFPYFLAINMIHNVGIFVPIWILAVAKFTDVGALLFGLKFGRTKMSPKLSPNKTWEGLAGGLVTAVMVGMVLFTLFENYFPVTLNLWKAGLICIPIALGGVVADLMESALKREAKVKDSGDRIPGIGGFFDLSDSILLALPIGYALFYIAL